MLKRELKDNLPVFQKSDSTKENPKDIFPEDLINLINKAKEYERRELRAFSSRNIPSVLVTQCENEAAGDGYSMETWVKQIVTLELALSSSKISSSEKIEIAQKVKEWIYVLYSKVAEQVSESSSLEELEKALSKKLINNSNKLFGQSSSFQNKQYQLQVFIVEIKLHIKNLSEKGFFEAYYKEKDLHQKYDRVIALSRECRFGSGLGFIVNALSQEIIKKAYKPVEAKKHQLMEPPHNSMVGELFNTLDSWFEKQVRFAKQANLTRELRKKLLEEKKFFETWKEINKRYAILEPREYRDADPFARDLVPLRLCEDLKKHPDTLLAELKYMLREKMPEAVVNENEDSEEELEEGVEEEASKENSEGLPVLTLHTLSLNRHPLSHEQKSAPGKENERNPLSTILTLCKKPADLTTQKVSYHNEKKRS